MKDIDINVLHAGFHLDSKLKIKPDIRENLQRCQHLCTAHYVNLRTAGEGFFFFVIYLDVDYYYTVAVDCVTLNGVKHLV